MRIYLVIVRLSIITRVNVDYITEVSLRTNLLLFKRRRDRIILKTSEKYFANYSQHIILWIWGKAIGVLRYRDIELRQIFTLRLEYAILAKFIFVPSGISLNRIYQPVAQTCRIWHFMRTAHLTPTVNGHVDSGTIDTPGQPRISQVLLY